LFCIKKTVKHVVSYFLFLTGLTSLLLKVRLKNRAVVLMYHRVVDDSEIALSSSHSGIIVSMRTFEKHIHYIRNHFNVLALSEFVTHMEHNLPFPDRACLITFDDGWRDNFTNAFPILNRHKVPAVIFLAADYVGSQKTFWQENFSRLLIKLRHQYVNGTAAGADIPGVERQRLERLLSSPESEMREIINDLVATQKQQPMQETIQLIEQLTKLLNPEPEKQEGKDRLLPWDEVEQMAALGIAFESHGKSHSILTTLHPKEAQAEIRDSKEQIEMILNKSVCAFSYPNGNYDDQIVALVRDSGYKVGFGVTPGYVSAISDPYRLCRINIHEDMTSTLPMFLGKLARLW
jgi:peptidoglycan/xylan/chitin deacetylase (PgdA/CDA1 family)